MDMVPLPSCFDSAMNFSCIGAFVCVRSTTVSHKYFVRRPTVQNTLNNKIVTDVGEKKTFLGS